MVQWPPKVLSIDDAFCIIIETVKVCRELYMLRESCACFDINQL